MSELEIVRPVPVDEAAAWVAALATTLLGDPHHVEFPRRVERWRKNWCAERTWGVRDGDRWVATLATQPRTVTVPGPGGTTRDVEADALTGVTVAATHRRRGLLTRMITESLQAAKDRGDPFSVLIAAEWPIYGRYGYGAATFSSTYTYWPRRRNAGLVSAPSGAVRQIEPAQLGTYADGIFDASRRQRPGQVDRRGPWWAQRLGIDGSEPSAAHWFVHESASGPDGLLAWKVTRDFELDGRMGAIEVHEFATASEQAYRNLWAYLSGIDVIEEVLLRDRPVDEPVRWLLADGRSLQQTHTGDYLWLRLLDVPAALAARTYAVPGRLVLDVHDNDLGGYGAGRFLLEADAGGATCTSTSLSADVRVSQRTLASVYLGGAPLRLLKLAGGVDELTPGAIDRADTMFASALAAWNATGF